MDFTQCAVESCLLKISVALGRAWFGDMGCQALRWALRDQAVSVPAPGEPPPDGKCLGVLRCWGLGAATFQEEFSEQVGDEFYASFSPTWPSPPPSWHGPWLGV